MKRTNNEGRSLDQSQDEIELRALMVSAQQGDAGNYKILLTRISKMLQPFVKNSFSRLGQKDGTDDVMQEILLAIHTKRATFDPAQYFLPWMYAIARYKIVDHLRRNNRHVRATIPIDDELESLEAVATIEVGSQADVLALCETLPAKQRDVLKLVKLEGLSVAEAAAKTGFTPSDIKVTVHRALKALQEKINEH